MDQKIRNAVEKYLLITGRTVLDKDYDGFIVFEDEDGIAFGKIVPSEGEFVDVEVFMKDFEETSCKWCAETDAVDVVIRCDGINVNVLNKSRAMIKHHVKLDLKED